MRWTKASRFCKPTWVWFTETKRSLPRVPGDFQMTFIKVETLCLVPSTFHFAINTILFVFFHSFNIC